MMKWHEYEAKKMANFSRQENFGFMDQVRNVGNAINAAHQAVMPVYRAIQKGTRFVSSIAKWITYGAVILGGISSLAAFKREWDLKIKNFRVNPDRFYILEHDTLRKERMRLLGNPDGYERDTEAYRVLTDLSGKGLELFLETGEKLATNYSKRFTTIVDPDIGKINILEFTPS